MSALLATQRRFLGALHEPLSGENRALAELAPGAAAPSDAFHATADELLRSTDAVHARERLGLYHRQYWFRLVDSLAEDFPRVRSVLGAFAFHAAIERHLLARPPACWTLRHLGAGFADHLRTDDAIPAPLRPWAGALADYEYARMKVFEAVALPAPADEDFPARTIVLQPSAVLVPTARPISRLIDGENTRPPTPAELAAAPARELHVVWRTSGHAIRARREPLSLHPLLRNLCLGGRLEKIVADTHPLPRAAAISDAFARWRSLGWLALAPATAPDSPDAAEALAAH